MAIYLSKMVATMVGPSCLITFLRHVFCTIKIESLQLIHRNDLKIKCKHKRVKICFSDVHRVMKPVVVAKILQEALRGTSWNILAPPTGFITR